MYVIKISSKLRFGSQSWEMDSIFAETMLTIFRRSLSISSSTGSNITKGEKLVKFIASTGICSRRSAEVLIKKGRIKVGGEQCTNVCQVLTKEQQSLVMLDDERISTKTTIVTPPKLWAIYKKRGEIVDDKDSKSRPLMLQRASFLIYGVNNIEALREVDKLKPAARLDYNAEGICLLSNNGLLARVLNNEVTNLTREYRVRIHGLITEEKLEGLRKGIYIDKKRQKQMPTTIESTSKTISWIKLTTTEASPRKIYDSLRQLHLDVTRIVCTSFGPYKAKDIGSAGFRQLPITPQIMKEFLQQQRLSIHKKRGIPNDSN